MKRDKKSEVVLGEPPEIPEEELVGEDQEGFTKTAVKLKSGSKSTHWPWDRMRVGGPEYRILVGGETPQRFLMEMRHFCKKTGRVIVWRRLYRNPEDWARHQYIFTRIK